MRKSRSESELGRLRNLASFGFSRDAPDLSSCGSTAIGIPREATTNGMTATGLDRHTRELIGLVRTTMVSSTLRATGTAIEGTYNTITSGTAIDATATMTTIAITGTIRIAAITRATTTIVTEPY